MIIKDNSMAFDVLISLIRRARSRIVFTCFIIEEDHIARRFCQAINESFRRGVRVLMYSKHEPLLGQIQGSKYLDKRIERITPKVSTHAKIFVVDDVVVSTDRNISKDYYTNAPESFTCSELLFKSKVISNAIDDYICDSASSEPLDITDPVAGYRLILGTIGEKVRGILAQHKNLRISSCTLIPSGSQKRLIADNKHDVVVSMKDFPCIPSLFDGINAGVTWMSAIPGRVWATRKCSHHKFFLCSDRCPRKFMWHGSYNIDVASESCCEEQMVYTENLEDILEIEGVYNTLKEDSVCIRRTPILPLFPIGELVIERVLKLWRKDLCGGNPAPTSDLK